MPDDAVAERVKALLESLPGVRLAWFQPSMPPGRARFGMQIENPRTLSWLVHLACRHNLLFVAEMDWWCKMPHMHDDPSCIRYDLRVPNTPLEDGGGDLAFLEAALRRELDRLKARAAGT